MPSYCFVCTECSKEADLFNVSYESIEAKRPQCCGMGMVRDFRREQFGGVAHRSKGVYGGDFVEEFGDGPPVQIDSYQQHERELKKRNLHFHERNPVYTYKRKHIKDFRR